MNMMGEKETNQWHCMNGDVGRAVVNLKRSKEEMLPKKSNANAEGWPIGLYLPGLYDSGEVVSTVMSTQEEGRARWRSWICNQSS